ncbi:hypothetical protein BC835DRAFT_1306651 [Cytidiella melzeri]|nr:hypothetical protein BC835DRAFT_1306651 [Cytidiella melzeri]
MISFRCVGSNTLSCRVLRVPIVPVKSASCQLQGNEQDEQACWMARCIPDTTLVERVFECSENQVEKMPSTDLEKGMKKSRKGKGRFLEHGKAAMTRRGGTLIAEIWDFNFDRDLNTTTSAQSLDRGPLVRWIICRTEVCDDDNILLSAGQASPRLSLAYVSHPRGGTRRLLSE